MTAPATPALHVDPLLSHARRTAEGVEVVLHLPGADFTRDRVRLRLRSARPDDETAHGFAARAAPTADAGTGRLVVALLPDDEHLHGTWRLQLRLRPEQPPRGLRTRLVLRPGQPVALLPSFAEAALGN